MAKADTVASKSKAKPAAKTNGSRPSKAQKDVKPTEPAAKDTEKNAEVAETKEAQDGVADDTGSSATAKPGRPSKKAADATKAKTKTDDATADDQSTNDKAIKKNNDKAKSAKAAETKSTTSKPTKANKPSAAANKRKAEVAADGDDDNSRRRSSRTSSANAPPVEQLLRYLLSPAAESLCRPDDETSDIDSHGSGFKTYSSTILSPFEELMSALVLSRPISHTLGLRTIRTVLNDPYNFSTPTDIKSAGASKVRQALEDARTQHKDKTAEGLTLLSQDPSLLSRVEKELKAAKTGSDNDAFEAMRDSLKAQIKGLGKTGLDIFCRRVQFHWDQCYPFIDSRTGDALRALGLPDDGDEMVEVIDAHWAKIGTKGLAGADAAAKKRRALVVILERAVGADLEGKRGAVLAAAHEA